MFMLVERGQNTHTSGKMFNFKDFRKIFGKKKDFKKILSKKRF